MNRKGPFLPRTVQGVLQVHGAVPWPCTLSSTWRASSLLHMPLFPEDGCLGSELMRKLAHCIWCFLDLTDRQCIDCSNALSGPCLQLAGFIAFLHSAPGFRNLRVCEEVYLRILGFHRHCVLWCDPVPPANGPSKATQPWFEAGTRGYLDSSFRHE